MVYQKMIIIFTVMLLFLYLISLALTNNGKNIIEEQYKDSLKSNISFYGEILDNHIFFIRTRQLQLFSNSNVEKLSFLGNLATGYEEVELVNGVRQEVGMINDSSNFIIHNGIIIESYDRVIDNRKGLIAKKDGLWDEIKEFRNQNENNILFQINDGLYLLTANEGNNIFSYIEISKEQLLETVSNIVKGTNDSAVFFVDNKTHQIISKDIVNESLILDISEKGTELHIEKEENGDAGHYQSFTIYSENDEYQIGSYALDSLDMTLYTYINKKEMTKKLSSLSNGFLILTIISFLIFILFAWLVNKMIHKPLNKLVLLFQNHREGSHVHLKGIGSSAGEFSYLYHSFNEMADRLDQSIKENYQQKLAIQNSELKQLQSQINPHFLYNSFYNIYRLSKMNDLDQVSLLSQKLASYYQFITKSGSDEVEFEKEYKHALDYCTIQKIRFFNRIDYSAPELNEEVKQIMVPRLILQPVIENAFEHAFENMERGVLKVHVAYENKELTITVEDNGDQLTDEALADIQNRLANPEREKEKTGIFNVSSRLKIRYGMESGLFASRSMMGGMKMEIKIKEG
ncbi:histidine kinase [Bacillus sp. IITD106]|nr:histidine kinase [Bacillus sp. IITD106]